MSDDVSICDYPCTFNGHKFTLRATQEALARVEHELGGSYAIPFQRSIANGPPRLTDVTAFFAALALPKVGKEGVTVYNGIAIRKLMPFDGGESLLELRDHVRAAINKAMPVVKEDAPGTSEGGGADDEDPTA